LELSSIPQVFLPGFDEHPAKRSAVVDCSSVEMGEGYIHSTRL